MRQNRIYQFSERDLMNDSLILSTTNLQCHVFSFEKLLLNVRFVKYIFAEVGYDVRLQVTM